MRLTVVVVVPGVIVLLEKASSIMAQIDSWG
jgi:hypothetical protein